MSCFYIFFSRMLHTYGTKETKKTLNQGCYPTKSHKINIDVGS